MNNNHNNNQNFDLEQASTYVDFNPTGSNNTANANMQAKPAIQDVNLFTGEINTAPDGTQYAEGQKPLVGLPFAEQNTLNEVLSDGVDSFNFQNAQAEDSFNNITSSINDLGQLRLDTLDETLSDASTAEQYLTSGATNAFNSNELASQSLANAENALNFEKYKNVTDALRGDRMRAARMGESAPQGVSDRMRLEAEMRAARDYADLANMSEVDRVKRTVDNTGVLNKNIYNAQNRTADVIADNNVAASQAQTATDIITELKTKEQNRQNIAAELATIMSTTQEQTLPAVTFAEMQVQQAKDEGKLVIETAEDMQKAIAEAAKAVLESPSLMEGVLNIAQQGEVTTAEDFNNLNSLMGARGGGLAAIEALEQEILSQVTQNEFDQSVQKLGYLQTLLNYAASLQLQTEQANVASNTYASEAAPTNTIADASTNLAPSSGDNLVSDIVTGIGSSVGNSIIDAVTPDSD